MNVMSRKSEIHNKLSSKGQRVGENLFSEPHAVHILSSVIYTQTWTHYVFQLFESQILLHRCLSRSLSVCSSLTKVTRFTAGSLQPWAANRPGNVCSPVPPRISPSVNQTVTEQGCHLMFLHAASCSLGQSTEYNLRKKKGNRSSEVELLNKC